MLGPQIEISKMTMRQNEGDLCADAQQRGRQPCLGAYSIVLRGTFIDIVGESEEEEAEECAGASRRARSDPGSRGSGGESASTFSGLVAYVEGLAERHSQLWGEAGSKSSRSSSAEDISTETSGMTPVTTSDGQDCELPAEASGMSLVPTLDGQDCELPAEASGMSLVPTLVGQDCELPATANSTMVHLQGLKLINIKSSNAEDTSTDFSGMSEVTTLDGQDCELPATEISTTAEVQGLKLINIKSSTAEDWELPATEISTTAQVQGLKLINIKSSTAEDYELPATAINTTASHADQLSGVAGSSGSVGHPYLCSRPCAYFVQGKCKSGEACQYCHLPHTKRPAHLDKVLKAEFNALPFQEIVSLVLPVLKQKVASLDSSLTTMALFADLASACDVAVVEHLRNPARQHRRLLGLLKAMSLRALLATAGTALSRHRPQIDALAKDLEHHVRASVVSAGGALASAQQVCQ